MEEEIVISSKNKGIGSNIKELIRYRDLIFLFVKKNFTLIYKQTVLGPMWLVIQPLFSSIIFTLIFGQLLGVSTDGIPQILFYVSGTALWTMFSSCLSGISTTFMSNAYLFSKVYFPRMAMPVSQAISGLMKFGIQFALVLIVYAGYIFAGYQFHVSAMVLWIPVLLIHAVVLAMAVGIIVSSLTIKYRDLSLATNLIVQLWMYGTPVVYPLSKASGKLLTVLLINPLTPIVNNFRYCLFGSGTFLTGSWILSAAVTVILLILGIQLFNKTESDFVDII